jgi:hypothetical protein
MSELAAVPLISHEYLFSKRLLWNERELLTCNIDPIEIQIYQRFSSNIYRNIFPVVGMFFQ